MSYRDIALRETLNGCARFSMQVAHLPVSGSGRRRDIESLAANVLASASTLSSDPDRCTAPSATPLQSGGDAAHGLWFHAQWPAGDRDPH